MPCTGGSICRNSTCVCPSGLTDCNGVCVDLTSDSGNCMRCGNTCLDGRVCDGGACVCPPDAAECSGACVDLATSEQHCGQCDLGCSPLQTCDNRTCGCGDLSACPGGTTGYCSRALERHCCGGGEIFCDVDDSIAYPGGCIQSGLDCGNLFSCGGDFVACSADSTGYCGSTGSPACCAADRPLFCDAVQGIDYPGGCWDADVSCNSISICGPVIFACRNDGVPYCSTTETYTCCEQAEIFCDARPSVGYDGGCWTTNINCASIANCGGGRFAACPVGAGTPNCTTNMCE
jgi:hypothetical protein